MSSYEMGDLEDVKICPKQGVMSVKRGAAEANLLSGIVWIQVTGKINEMYHFV